VTNNEIKGIDIELNKLSGEFRMIDRLRAQQTKSKTVEAAGEVKTEEKKDGNEGGQ